MFDEPTAVLTESEADRLLEVMRVIASQGIAIIFITHRLDEVMAVADSMTILRDGEFVASKAIRDTNVTRDCGADDWPEGWRSWWRMTSRTTGFS